MRLSGWRTKAPGRAGINPKILDTVGSILMALGAEADPHCWVTWGDETASRWALMAPCPAGLAVVNVRAGGPQEGITGRRPAGPLEQGPGRGAGCRGGARPPPGDVPARGPADSRRRRAGRRRRRVRRPDPGRGRGPAVARSRPGREAPSGGSNEVDGQAGGEVGAKTGGRRRGPAARDVPPFGRRLSRVPSHPPRSPAAVIFDLDGVLVDAEVWWDEVRRPGPPSMAGPGLGPTRQR